MFQIIKATSGGVCNNGRANLQEMLSSIKRHDGWNGMEELHDHLSTWAAKAKIGDIFTTSNEAIVYVGVPYADVCPNCQEGFDTSYSEFTVNNGMVEQNGVCKHCEHGWKDIFVLSRRQIQPPAAKHQAVGTRKKPTKKKK